VTIHESIVALFASMGGFGAAVWGYVAWLDWKLGRYQLAVTCVILSLVYLTVVVIVAGGFDLPSTVTMLLLIAILVIAPAIQLANLMITRRTTHE
jgi:hypothetical protein